MERAVSKVKMDEFSEDCAEVCRYSQISALMKLRLVQAGPSSINLPAFYGSAHDQHHVGVAMIRAPIFILACCAPELRHGDYDCVSRLVAEINPECGKGLGKLLQQVRELSLACALVLVMIPSSDIDKSDLHSEVGFY